MKMKTWFNLVSNDPASIQAKHKFHQSDIYLTKD